MRLQDREINCSICHKPVALETAKTDERGQALHEECYLLNLGIETGPRTPFTGQNKFGAFATVPTTRDAAK